MDYVSNLADGIEYGRGGNLIEKAITVNNFDMKKWR
jgi:hypothetical protein